MAAGVLIPSPGPCPGDAHWTGRRRVWQPAMARVVVQNATGREPILTETDQNDALHDALTRCASGERAALRQIFDSEAGRLLGIATRILRRRELAEEAVQDAFVQVWLKAGQYSRDRGSPRGWLGAIVRNRSLNMLRDGKREEATDGDRLSEMLDAGAIDEAEAAYSALAARSRLRECLEGLDADKRRCILMAYVSGYTHGEIAGRLKIPLGTAKAWVRRGLASLRDCMA